MSQEPAARPTDGHPGLRIAGTWSTTVRSFRLLARLYVGSEVARLGSSPAPALQSKTVTQTRRAVKGHDVGADGLLYNFAWTGHGSRRFLVVAWSSTRVLAVSMDADHRSRWRPEIWWFLDHQRNRLKDTRAQAVVLDDDLKSDVKTVLRAVSQTAFVQDLRKKWTLVAPLMRYVLDGVNVSDDDADDDDDDDDQSEQDDTDQDDVEQEAADVSRPGPSTDHFSPAVSSDDDDDQNGQDNPKTPMYMGPDQNGQDNQDATEVCSDLGDQLVTSGRSTPIWESDDSDNCLGQEASQIRVALRLPNARRLSTGDAESQRVGGLGNNAQIVLAHSHSAPAIIQSHVALGQPVLFAGADSLDEAAAVDEVAAALFAQRLVVESDSDADSDTDEQHAQQDFWRGGGDKFAGFLGGVEVWDLTQDSDDDDEN